jgi:hypothetical protein
VVAFLRRPARRAESLRPGLISISPTAFEPLGLVVLPPPSGPRAGVLSFLL